MFIFIEAINFNVEWFKEKLLHTLHAKSIWSNFGFLTSNTLYQQIMLFSLRKIKIKPKTN